MSIKKRATYNRKRNSEILANMAAPPAPTAPATVQPFATADDMLAVNDWLTNFTTQMEDIDFGIAQLETDTKYQKGQNDRQAVENRSASDDAMAARGVFSSSLRDAAVMDVEATRSLANTYLDTKLQEAVTSGTTRKNTLATAKTNFETGMLSKYGENAAPLNAAQNDAYASAIAAYKPPAPIRPKLAPPPVAPVVASSKPQATTPTKPKPAPKASINSPKPKKPAKPKAA